MISTTTEKIELIASIEEGLIKMGVAESLADLVTLLFALGVLVTAIFAANFLFTKLLRLFADRVVRKTKALWDDYLLDRKFFTFISHFILWLVVIGAIDALFVGFNPEVIEVLTKISKITALYYVTRVIYSLLDVLIDIYNTTSISKEKSIKGYIQTGKILVAITTVVSSLLILFNIDITIFLTSIAASAAVVSFIFKDTILGFVSSVQLSSLDLVRLGDWVKIPSKGVDGEVIDLSLTTVKVQNWNLSVVASPIYMLAADSFVNWRYMREGNGRRFKRKIALDLLSIEPANPSLLDGLKTHYLTASWAAEYTKNPQKENCTNLSLFRHFINQFLANNPSIEHRHTAYIYFDDMEDKGLPIVLYGFTKDKSWEGHENSVADILEQVFATLPLFNLTIYQRASTPPRKTDEENN